MTETKTSPLPALAGIGTAVLWGFSFLFTKGALDYTFPLQLLGFRFAIGDITMAILIVAGVIKVKLRGRNWLPLVFLSLFQPGLYFLGETWGVKWTSASEAGMIIALVPVAVATMARIFLKERLHYLQVISIISSVAGVFVIVIAQSAQGQIQVGQHINGIFALLLAVIAAGAYSILSKKSSELFSPVEITYVMMWCGTILFNLLGLGQSILQGNLTSYFGPLFNREILTAVLYLGVLSSVLGFFLFNYAISRLKVSQTASITNLITVVSVFAGVAFNGDAFSLVHLAGVALIIFGVWGTNVFGQKGIQ
ncbi:MAG: EamA family transporter [Desulfitobacterium hafniense]|nr:EamA family transporter [Desulfitobacterium hafniense]